MEQEKNCAFQMEKIKETTELLLLGKITKLEADNILSGLISNNILPDDNTKLRQVVIGQSGYGIDGCRLCGSRWMRRPNTEKTDHKKDCPAYPKATKNNSVPPISGIYII